jgi:NAD(P)-dependent dehydrogenase (short-subunit alcohol dehydrogenase family)
VVKEVKKSGGEAIAFPGNISQPQIAKSVVQQAIDTYGRLDILINNAGTMANLGFLEEYDDQDFQNLITNNVQSVYYMTKYALPHLQKSKGNIISAGSEAGVNGLAQDAPYGGTKAWIHAFMKGVAVEQARHGVRANCVLPGPIDTEMTRRSEGPMSKKMETIFVEPLLIQAALRHT